MWVRKGSQSIVLFLPGCVPEPQVDMFPINFKGSSIVIKNSGDIICGELILGIADEDAGLPDTSIAHDD